MQHLGKRKSIDVYSISSLIAAVKKVTYLTELRGKKRKSQGYMFKPLGQLNSLLHKDPEAKTQMHATENLNFEHSIKISNLWWWTFVPLDRTRDLRN